MLPTARLGSGVGAGEKAPTRSETWHDNTDSALPDNKKVVVAKHQAVLEEEMEFPLGDPVDEIRFYKFQLIQGFML